MRLRVGHQQSQFRPILAHFVDYCTLFGGPEVISMIDEPRGAFMSRFMDYYSPFWGQPRVRLRVGHQHSQFLSILVYFVHYYLRFWGPRAISMIDEPRGAFTCPSSTLTVLANSDPFRGLLLTVLGSRNNFHSC